jgi:hypothetical protein
MQKGTDPVNRNTLFASVDIWAVLSIIVPLCVYLLTLAPTVTFYDSGEFLTAVSSLGAPHSPGYPLFVNYAKPFTWLPFGSIAFRVNFATAVSASLACLGVYLLTVRVLAESEDDTEAGLPQFLRRSAGLCAALAFAFSPRLWLQSNHDKPYPLLAFLAALIFWLLLVWREKYLRGEEYPGLVYLGAFLCGLAFGAHQIIVLLVPSFAFLVLVTDRRLITRVREQLLALSFFFVGFSVYLHLPVRAMANPLLNWGDPQSLSRFLWSFLRKGYPMEKVDRDLHLLLKQLTAFNLVHEFTAVGLFLILVGAVACRNRRKEFIIAFGIAIAVFLAYIVGYQNTPEETIFLTEEFFTPLYLLAAVFIGIGIFSLTRMLAGAAGTSVRRARPVLLLLPALLPAALCTANFHENDQHENFLAFDYAANTFRSLPTGAALFTWGDSGAFPLWYLQGVERMREDLDLLHIPHLQFVWYLDTFPHLFRESALRKKGVDAMPIRDVLVLAMGEQMARRPVFLDFSTRYSVESGSLPLVQRGIVYQLAVRAQQMGEAPDTSLWDLYSLRGVLGERLFFRDLDSDKAVQIYAYSRLDAGRTLLSLGRTGEGSAELLMSGRLSPAMLGEARRIMLEHGVR